MLKAIASLVLFLVTSCAPMIADAPPNASPTPSASAGAATPSSSATLRATGTFSMPTDNEMNVFAADRGALVAFSTKDGLPPYASKIQRAEAPSGPWKTVFETDASFVGSGQVVSGRAAVIEYREPFQGGGAYSEDFAVVDLSTGNATAIDRFALSSATYRGGGALTRRPVGRMVLGPDRVAWTRLVEGPAGSVTGELRVATLAEPARAKIVAASAEWISPLGVDAHRLLYVLGGKVEDQLHLLDLDTGADRVIASGAMPTDIQVGPVPGLDRAALSGDWAIWLDTPRAGPGTLRAVNVASGAQRTIDAGGSSCSEPSVGTRYVAWYCSAGVAGILDAKTLESLATKPTGMGVAPVASDDALLWFDLSTKPRQVVLYRPQIPTASAPSPAFVLHWMSFSTNDEPHHRLLFEGGSDVAFTDVRLLAPDGAVVAEGPALPTARELIRMCGRPIAFGPLRATWAVPTQPAFNDVIRRPEAYRVEARVAGHWIAAAVVNECHLQQ